MSRKVWGAASALTLALIALSLGGFAETQNANFIALAVLLSLLLIATLGGVFDNHRTGK